MIMQYYKYIEMDNCQKILDNTKRFVKERYLHRLRPCFEQIDWDIYTTYCPEILTALDKYDLKLYTGFIYMLYSNSTIHVDYKSDVLNKCRINIPAVNCEYSKTVFYKTSSTSKTENIVQSDIIIDPNNKNNQKNVNFFKYDENDPTVIPVTEMTLNSPAIMRVQEAHQVIVDNEHLPRVVLTLHSYKDPVFLLEND